MGLMLSVISYLTYMSNQYQTSCIIPLEWKNFIVDEKVSLSVKGIIVIYAFQWIFLIPVIICSMAQWSINPGSNVPVESLILIFLYLFFLLCGNLIYSNFYKKQKAVSE